MLLLPEFHQGPGLKHVDGVLKGSVTGGYYRPELDFDLIGNAD